jgi:hypothetical protein
MGVFQKYCWAMPAALIVVLPAFHGISDYLQINSLRGDPFQMGIIKGIVRF